VVGATFQSVFRNPLADSGLLGVGAGTALGAVAAVKLGWGENLFLAVPLAAFAGAMAAVLLVYGLGHLEVLRIRSGCCSPGSPFPRPPGLLRAGHRLA
jgi:ABC-type Fe3+-siderophore transport system permease subunit